MEKEEANNICDLVRNFSMGLEGLLVPPRKRTKMTQQELLEKILHRVSSFQTAIEFLLEQHK